jgi:HPt (histidine-containing phosphotransfer) domain-containing protein
MKLTLRFLILVLSLLAAVGACVAAGTRALGQLDQALQRVVHEDMERLLSITHARRVFRSMGVLERDYILSKKDSERREMATKMQSIGQELLQHLSKYERTMPSADRATVQSIRETRGRWLALHAKVEEAAARNPDEALALSKQHAKDPVSWETAIGGLVKLSERRLADQVAATHTMYSKARTTLLLVSACAAALALGLGTLIFLGIRRTMNEVVDLNSNLEKLVETRTAALADRERSLRLVLDSTGDALIGVDLAGNLTGESSAAAERWFGAPKLGEPAGEYLFQGDERAALGFQLALSQLSEDFLPWEVSVDQMPRRLVRGELSLGLEYKPIQQNGVAKSYLLIARDITASVEREKLEKNSREQQALISKLLADRRGFEQFVNDCEELLAELPNERDLTVAKRTLHTLKGNTAIFGLDSFAERCHLIEDQVQEDNDLPSALAVSELAALWRARMQSIREFLSNVGGETLELERQEHEGLIQSLLSRRDYDEILNNVEAWSWTRASERLSHLRAQVEYVAQRLNKQVAVRIEHNDLRIPPGYLDRVWSTLVHAVRNAVDHGIEQPERREERGKSPTGLITLRTVSDDTSLRIEISDDGGGIDWGSLRRAAAQRGIVSDAVSPGALLFEDGLSIKDEANEFSGRGVGMGALREACQKYQGRIQVASEAGKGTTLSFSFPRPVVKLGALAKKLERRWSLIPQSNSETRRSARPLSKSSNG